MGIAFIPVVAESLGGAPPHSGGPAEAAGQGGLHEDRGGGGDRLQPPSQQGLDSPQLNQTTFFIGITTE